MMLTEIYILVPFVVQDLLLISQISICEKNNKSIPDDCQSFVNANVKGVNTLLDCSQIETNILTK